MKLFATLQFEVTPEIAVVVPNLPALVRRGKKTHVCVCLNAFQVFPQAVTWKKLDGKAARRSSDSTAKKKIA